MGIMKKENRETDALYAATGFKNRQEYIEWLAIENDVDFETVCALADVLGINEDFDGLINALQDL